MTDPPPNPFGGKTLIVDANSGDSYPRPSTALLDAGEYDQGFVRPGVYEDKVFITGRPIHLVGAGRDEVQIFSRRGGLSISSRSQAVSSRASRFDMSEVIRIQR